METDEASADATTAPATDDKKIDDLSAEEKVQQNTIEKLTTILSGEKSIYCHLQFLIRYLMLLYHLRFLFLPRKFLSLVNHHSK